MTLEQAIIHCYEVAHSKCDTKEQGCRDEHKQLAKWLEELKELRQQNGINEAIPQINGEQAVKITHLTLMWLDETIMLIECIRRITRGRYKKPFKLFTLGELTDIALYGDKLKEMLIYTLYERKNQDNEILDTNPFHWLITHERCASEATIKRIQDASDCITIFKMASACVSSVSVEFHKLVYALISKLNETYHELRDIRDDFVKKTKYLGDDTKDEALCVYEESVSPEIWQPSEDNHNG